MLRRSAFFTGVTLALMLVAPSHARADDDPVCSLISLDCEKQASTSPSPGESSRPSPGAAERRCAQDGVEVPCSSPDGVWAERYGCYLKPAPEQVAPPPGKKAGDGQWYLCTFLPTEGGAVVNIRFWIDGPPPTVDPGQVARDILARIQLQRVVIGVTPEPGKTGVLGLPTYLWVDNPGPRTLGPIGDSETVAGVTVTLTAHVSKVVWSLGDGATVTCVGAGTPYRDQFGAKPSPTCGHTYRRPSTGLPGGAYKVSATAVWDVAWSGAGQSGTIPFEVTSGTSIRIGEVQALN